MEVFLGFSYCGSIVYHVIQKRAPAKSNEWEHYANPVILAIEVIALVTRIGLIGYFLCNLTSGYALSLIWNIAVILITFLLNRKQRLTFIPIVNALELITLCTVAYGIWYLEVPAIPPNVMKHLGLIPIILIAVFFVVVGINANRSYNGGVDLT